MKQRFIVRKSLELLDISAAIYIIFKNERENTNYVNVKSEVETRYD